jgi:hypothetical protein
LNKSPVFLETHNPTVSRSTNLRTDHRHRSYPSDRVYSRVNPAFSYTPDPNPVYKPQIQIMADPEMDEFAQTRGADDLFDDEIIPVSAEEQQAQTEVIAPEPEPEVQEVHVAETPAAEKAPPRGDAPQRGRGGERGRRRGRGKGRGGPESEQKKPESSSRKKNANAPAANAREASPRPEKVDASKETGLAEESNGQEAVNSDAQRVPAVRGDRSATGGTRKV